MTFSHAPKRNSEGRRYCKALLIDYARALESVVDLKLPRNSQVRKRKVQLRGKENINEGVEAAIFARTLRPGIWKVSCVNVVNSGAS